jgi:hypothetical protein
MRAVAVALTVLAGAACQPPLPARPHLTGPAAAFGHQGRWFTDGAGRVVMLRGVNVVEKGAPFTPW